MYNLYKTCSHDIQFTYVLWVVLPKYYWFLFRLCTSEVISISVKHCTVGFFVTFVTFVLL